MSKDKRIFITGGAGYIGSVLVRLLLDNNYSVIVFDNMRWGDESLSDVKNHPNLKIIKGDVTDEIEYKNALSGVYGIVHLAAIVGDPACKKEPQIATDVNFIASKRLFETAKQSGVKRFIFASTCSNYGKMAQANGYVNETSVLKPVSLYAQLKVDFENYILNSKKQDDFIPISLRFATVYGISKRMRFDLTINEFVRDLYFGKELLVFGEKFWRPYCHVSDVGRACLLALEAPQNKMSHEVFNVGETGENYQKEMLIGEINKFIKNTKVKYVPQNDDPRDYKVDFTKIKNVLGFKVTKRVPDGIQEIIDSLSRNILKDPFDKKYQNS